MKRLVVAAILAGASLIPSALSASAQSTRCTTTLSGDTFYTDCTEPPRLPTPAPTATPAGTQPDALTVYVEESRARAHEQYDAAVRYHQELANQQAAALARQQPGDTGMTISVYGKPVHYDYGAFFRRGADTDVYMVANGQLHYLNAYAYDDVGVVSDLSNVEAVNWMKPDMYGDPF